VLDYFGNMVYAIELLMKVLADDWRVPNESGLAEHRAWWPPLTTPARAASVRPPSPVDGTARPGHAGERVRPRRDAGRPRQARRRAK
jgi:hypothetical protein